MKAREYKVTASTFYVYSRHRGLWEAYYRDEDGLRHPINEYCETDHDAVDSCIHWQLRTDKGKTEPPF